MSIEPMWKWKKVKSLSPVWLFVTPWTVAYQVPPSMGFSTQEYWSGLPFPSPGESSPARDQTWISCIVGRFFTNWATREAALSQSCHPNISSFVAPFSSSPHSFLASGSFLWVSSLYQVAKVLQLQLQSFQWIFRVDFFLDWLVWSPYSPRDSLKSHFLHHSLKASTLRCSAFFMIQLSCLYMTTGTQLWLCGRLLAKWCLLGTQNYRKTCQRFFWPYLKSRT